MNVHCLIPARGGSKRLLAKNLMTIGGRPLLAWSLIHARESALVDTVIVSTDDDDIASLAGNYGAEVVIRPATISSDTASSESALIHALDARVVNGQTDPDLVVFLQCTSPARCHDDIDNAIRLMQDTEADSVFSACENSRLIWGMQADDPVALNYDWRNRRREQEMARQYRENGSIYVFTPELLRRTNNRMGGRKRIYVMDYWSSFQVDTSEHAALLDWILQQPEYASPVTWPSSIDLLVFDFDGVMTNNSALIDEHGEESICFNRADGLGINQMQSLGVPMLILSTETNPVVTARSKKLQIEVKQGLEDKAVQLAEIFHTRQCNPDRVIYVGNDVNDLGCFSLVGHPVAVADAHPQVRACARHILTTNGGEGAVRELCDSLAHHIKRQKE